MEHIVLWGTGDMGTQLMQQIERLNRYSERIVQRPCIVVDDFLDCAENKAGQMFFGKAIVSPDHYDWKKNASLIVVAVVKNREIVSQLQSIGRRPGCGYITLKEFPRWMYECASTDWMKALALTKAYAAMKMAWSSFDDAERAIAVTDRFWEAAEDALVRRGREAEVAAVQDIWTCAQLLSGSRPVGFDSRARWFLQRLGVLHFVELMETCYGGDVMAAAAWMMACPPPVAAQRPIKTIGMYYRRLYNGGTERVVSELCFLFRRHGYEVVLFTDIADAEREYPLPEGVVRVVLGADTTCAGRCRKILSAIRDYHVDVYCSHATYSLRGMLELVCLQQAGIPVMLEAHQCFRALVDALGMDAVVFYRRMDALVTLSRTDALFWRLLGCRSIYIPNPVAPPLGQADAYEPNTILWLQRIEQEQKQVYELPGILKRVVARIPDAMLLLVGASDSRGTEEKLKSMFEAQGLADHVTFEGYHAEVTPYYRKAAVMLMTSAFEGFPMTVAESKQHGVPLVLYELPYLELLKDGRGYVAVPQHDQDAAAEAIVRILNDRTLRNKLSREAQESLSAFCNTDLMAAWERAFALAMHHVEMEALTEEELQFQEIEQMMIGLTQRERAKKWSQEESI